MVRSDRVSSLLNLRRCGMALCAVFATIVFAMSALPVIAQDAAPADEKKAEAALAAETVATPPGVGGIAETSETVPKGDEHAGEHGGGGHSDPVVPVLIGIIVILLAAKIGGHVFELMGQPSVLGELVFGMLIGNLPLIGYSGLEFLTVDYNKPTTISLQDPQTLAGVSIDHLSRIGVILLLFQVGLESSIGQMMKVGLSALVVAVIGVICPMILGYGVGMMMLPKAHWAVHLFLGATLSATSVGITARVLKDLGKSTTKEAQIVLGAAVIDDVLGLVVLALVQGIIVSLDAATRGAASSFGAGELGMIVGKAMGFLVGALVLGRLVCRPLFLIGNAARGKGLLVTTSLLLCFVLSWLANLAGLAPIVGAFAAGLILDDVHYRELKEKEGVHHLDDLIRPLTDMMVPIFFVVMGMNVDLRSFADLNVLGLAALLTIVAIIGKQACAVGVLEKGTNRLAVGLGMIPRGEVGLIFAAIGLSLKIGSEHVVDSSSYSALVVMVMVTTMVTPPLLKWSLSKPTAGGNS